MPAGAGAVATTVQSKFRESVSVLDFCANGVSGAPVDPTGVIESTLGFQAAINTGKRVLMPNGAYKIGPLTLLQGTEIVGETKAGVTIKPIGALPIFTWVYATSGVLFGLKIHNFTVDLTGFASAQFMLINGMQSGKIGDIKFKFGTAIPVQIEFSYFNEYQNLHFYQTASGLLLTGTSYGDGPNHNVIRNTRGETMTSWVVKMNYCRGNVIDIFDAEYSNDNLESAIILDNCSYCHIKQFWYEALSATVAAPAILIQGESTSTNKKNSVIWSPQIIHPTIGIQVSNSLDCRLEDVRFVGGTTNIQETGNTGLSIANPQTDSPAVGLINAGSNSTKIIIDGNLTQTSVASFTVASTNDGYNSINIKNAGVTKFSAVTKPNTDEVSMACNGGDFLKVQNTTRFLVPVAGAMQYVNAITATAAGTRCVFVDSADGILKFKDGSGVTHPLY